MNTKIKATNITVTVDISNYVNKRLEAVVKLFKHDPTTQMDIELARTTEHHKNGEIFKAEVHITAKGEDLYASAEESDIYKAIDAVRDDILREARSSKSKKTSLVRRSGIMVKNLMKGLWPGKNKNL
ncbi:MAG: ribosome-associated translation inhibitor RaiA [Patescibacteria group bacterium]